MKTQYLTIPALASVAYTQSTDTDNPIINLQSCANLACLNATSGSICRQSIRATGLGIAPEIIDIPNTNPLSLTLIDGDPSGVIAAQAGGFEQSTPTLYVGVTPGFDVESQPAACALMMQYEGQTFPELGTSDPRNSTSCESIFPSTCRETFAELVGEFVYDGNSGNNSTGITLNRCEALAEFITTNIKPNLSFCGWFSGLVNITGGTILGPGSSTDVVRLQESGCQPTSPNNYELHEVASMYQIIRPSSKEFFSDFDDTQLRVGAGRKGITPVVSVVYDGSNSSSPEVQWTCMKTYAQNGEVMPNSLNFPSAAVSQVPRMAMVVMSLAISLQVLL